MMSGFSCSDVPRLLPVGIEILVREMGIVHIPRTIASCARGYYRRWSSPLSIEKLAVVGIGPNNPHRYQGRVGLFDFDSLGHMNNAAYLTHAELARWEMSALNGSLVKCVREKYLFIANGCTVRYRKEIGPFKRFDIETYVGSFDKRNIWMYQTFRQPGDGGRILAQFLLQVVVVKDQEVLDPREFIENCGINAATIEELSQNSNNQLMQAKISSFQQLESVLRESAAADDVRNGTSA